MSGLVLEEEAQPYLNFINSLKSKETKKEYRNALFKFVKHYNTTLEGLLGLGARDIEQKVINYITNMNAKGLSHGYINLGMATIFHFFDMNDVVLNKKKVGKFMGEKKRSNTDRAYTHEEIKMLADTGDFRFRALVLFLASTGVRIGAIPSLLFRHIDKKVQNATVKEGNIPVRSSSGLYSSTSYVMLVSKGLCLTLSTQLLGYSKLTLHFSEV